MMKQYNVDLHVRIPIPLDQRIESYCNTLRKRSKAEGIKELIEIALVTVENWTLIKKDPNRIEEIHKQFSEGELVDSIQNMDQRDFKIIFDIFKTENKARYGSKFNGLLSSLDKTIDR